jgi:hypothetical protein
MMMNRDAGGLRGRALAIPPTQVELLSAAKCVCFDRLFLAPLVFIWDIGVDIG